MAVYVRQQLSAQGRFAERALRERAAEPLPTCISTIGLDQSPSETRINVGLPNAGYESAYA